MDRFADRLRTLRLAEGLTLAELAERTGGIVTKQAVSKYEKSAAFPRPTVLVALARALGVKTAELVAEPEYEISCLGYRTRAALPPRAQERVEASLRRDLERRVRLEDRLFADRETTLPAEPVPVSDPAEAEALAARIRGEWGLGSEPIASVSEVLERNSVHVFEYRNEDDFDGLAAVARRQDGSLRAVGIAENPDTAGDRQRFNLAHELAHVVMDAAPELDEEQAAHRFAGAFLVPAELVHEEVGRRRAEVSLDELILLKQRWGVSIQSILHRLLDLDVISQAHYDWWRREIKALGYARVEPAALDREVSTWERRQVARAEAEGIMSREQASAYLTPRHAARPTDGIDRRALMKLPLEERRAIIKMQAEQLVDYYDEVARGEWLEADLDDD